MIAARNSEHYRRLRSLTEYLLIAQDVSHVEHYVRQPDDRWLLTEVRETQDVITLSSVGCRVALADVYEQVEIPAAAGLVVGSSTE
ncbi:Uma2 family endonuclease [Candidatus Amarolinea dominans]|uniref:Uma2 family endonuclease n=1 Tax=Candidatus Amarolinea dominans TaxID=3140696 RepID=UPI0031CC662B